MAISDYDINLDSPLSDDLFDASDDFDLELAAEGVQVQNSDEVWKVLIVDDEQDIHTVIRLALENFRFEGRKLQFVDAYSAAEAKNLLREHADVAVLLLDVVMENHSAGLHLVEHIRQVEQNPFVRIVLWTGQPGHAPEKKVIEHYEINDYRAKTELTSDKLFAVVLSALRNYRSLLEIESYRRNLEDKVSERTRVLQQQTVELEKANSTKDKFLRIISHDLKNPMAAMLSISDSLLTHAGSFDKEDILDGLRRIHHSSTQVFQLLQNLLDWARAQSRQMNFEPHWWSVASLVQEVVSLHAAQADKKSIDLLSEVPEGLKVWGDKNMLETVVRNLLSNAIKFSPNGATVSIKAGNGTNDFFLAVCDQGAGLPEELAERFFEAPSSHSTPGTAHEQGSGLGLLICRELVARHKGSLAYKRNKPTGSVFSLHLPHPEN